MKLSYSSIDTYETCPAKYRFQFEERVPRKPSPALAFGSSVHEALYRFHDRPVPVAPPLEELLETLDDVWVAEGYPSENEERLHRDHAREVLRRYHRENAEGYRIPAALEFRFRIEVGEVTLTGVIDRMDRLPEGGYEIIDYKTNRRLPPRKRIDRDLQLTLYYLAAREVWGIEPERLTLYFLIPGERMSTTRTPADAEDALRRIASVAERIEASHFEPRENPLCRWCDFQPICPLFRHGFEPEPAPRITDVVDEWVILKREQRDRARRLEELGAIIRAYAGEHDHQRLFGTAAAVQIVEDGSLALSEPRAGVRPAGAP